jgi:hypothetical protein
MNTVALWNLALGHVRAAPVGSVDEFSRQALACKNVWDFVRASALSEAPWRFATRRYELAELAQESPEWAHVYALPAGFLRAWTVSAREVPKHVPAPEIEYEILADESGNSRLFSNYEGIRAKITTDVEVGRYTHTFSAAVAHLLAANIAVPIAGIELGTRLQQAQMEMYRMAIGAASSEDASHHRIEPRKSKYISARG